MAFRCAEYAGPPITGINNLLPSGSGFIRATALTPAASTGSTGNNIVLSSGTYLVLLTSDVTALVAFGSSISTGPTMTSTLAQLVPANAAPLAITVRPYAQLFVSST